MDWTAAAVGATPGLLALAWNMLSWERSGPVVEVTAANELPVFGDDVGEDWFIGVVANNKGRSPIHGGGFWFSNAGGWPHRDDETAGLVRPAAAPLGARRLCNVPITVE